jgi:hypothetical protein
LAAEVKPVVFILPVAVTTTFEPDSLIVIVTAAKAFEDPSSKPETIETAAADFFKKLKR